MPGRIESDEFTLLLHEGEELLTLLQVLWTGVWVAAPDDLGAIVRRDDGCVWVDGKYRDHKAQSGDEFEKHFVYSVRYRFVSGSSQGR